MLGGLIAADAPAVRVTATPSKAEVTVGERFTVELHAEGPAGTAWTVPVDAGNEQVELHAEPAPASPPPAPPADASRMRYDAAVFALKDASVPEIIVKYRLPDGSEGEVKTAVAPLRVGSLLPKDEKERTLADIREPVPLGVGRAFWIAAAVSTLVLIGLAVWLAGRRRPAAGAPASGPTDVPPHVEALRTLDALLASERLERGEYRPFYIALTTLAKRYLERRLEAPVLEMTSAEMSAFLRDHVHAHSFLPALRDLSGAADRIKFARGEGQNQEGLRHASLVRELILGLEARLTPAPATEGARA
jgi:hypothetical protein